MQSDPIYQPDISIVVPVFNSANTLEPLFERIEGSLTAAGKTFEVIFVFDGGAETAWKALIKLKKAHPDHITAIRLARNFGQHNATLCGLSFAKAPLIVTIDDDLQTPPEAIMDLVERQKESGADVVYGVYPKQKHGLFRNLASKAFKKIYSYLSKGLEGGSSFRLIKRTLAEDIQRINHTHIFIDQLLSWYTDDFAFVEVTHYKREDGKSGYTTWKLFKMAFNVFLSYTDLPLRLVTLTGVFSSLLSIILGTAFIIQRLSVGAQIGFTALISAIFFTSGVILLSLGILGEYISRIYQSRLEKPAYTIKAIL